jgi:hypothetical protein
MLHKAINQSVYFTKLCENGRFIKKKIIAMKTKYVYLCMYLENKKKLINNNKINY